MSNVESAGFVIRAGSERRVRKRFVIHERRSGFERRVRSGRSVASAALDAVLIHLRDNTGALLAVLGLVNVISLLDLVFTTLALRLGATEGNPLMRHVLAISPGAAAVLKIAACGGASLVIWKLRRHRSILKLALFALVAFAGVVLYECVALSLLV